MFHHIFRLSPIATTLTLLPAGCYVDVNLAAERLLGYSRDELLGQRWVWATCLTPEVCAELLRLFAAQGRIESFPCTLTTRSGDSCDCLISIESIESDGQAYALSQIVNVSGYHQATLGLREAKDISMAAARLQLLADASTAFAADGTDEHALLNTLARCTAEALGATCFIRLRYDDDPWLALVAGYAPPPALPEAVRSFYSQTRIAIDSPHPEAQVVRGGQARLFPAISPGVLRALLPPELVPLSDPVQLHSGLITLLRTRGQTLGCLVLVRHTPGQPAFTQDDLTLAQDLADRAGLVLANARLYREVHTAQQTAQQAHAQLHALIASLPTGIGYFDRELRYQLVNPAMAVINHRSPAEHIGQAVSTIVPDLAPEIEPLLRQVLATGKAVIDLEVQGGPHPSGHGFYSWLVSYFPVPGPENEIASVGVTLTDITASKRAELALRELNHTLEERVQQRTAEIQDLYDHAPTGYYSTNADGQIVRMNQTLLDWLGYTREEVLGRWGVEFLAPEIRAAFVAQIPAFQQRSQVQGLDAQLLRKDGSSFPVLLSVTSVYDADGVYVSNRATVFDNTERKQAEEALRESEAQNRLLFEESPEAVALFNQHNQIVRANRAFAQLVGYPIERLQDQSLAALGLLSSAQVAQLLADVGPAMRHGSGFAEAIVAFERADGDTRVAEVRAFALTIHGQWHFLASVHDITRERQTEETLRQANAELARAARAKDEFLANMSHELRTPINAILGYSESLQEQIYGPLSERQRSAIGYVETSGRHLLSLINDILDVAKIEAGRLDLQIEPVQVQEVCQASLLFVREQAIRKQLRLGFRLNDQLASIEADVTRLKQILVNLLSNAVKFTPAGGMIGLDVAMDAEEGLARFTVYDSGIGIAPPDLGRLFQPFSQIDSSLSRAHEGSGLGLVLVRRLAEAHGGSVGVESEPGRGSRFTVVLPYRCSPARLAAVLSLQPATAIATTPDCAGAPTQGQILLADDNEVNVNAIREYLQAMGYAVSVARDGYEVLAIVDQLQPQLILMDIQMPQLDGLMTIQRLRALPAYAATPIIALTALAMPGDEARCLAAGATAYMSKPVSMRSLVQMMRRLLAV